MRVNCDRDDEERKGIETRKRKRMEGRRRRKMRDKDEKRRGHR